MCEGKGSNKKTPEREKQTAEKGAHGGVKRLPNSLPTIHMGRDRYERAL